ncbi:MAG: DedA family protein [Bacteroidota bacterium]|jgi:membrane protein DedA with SNARE-associated domain|nr:DedA family protein [Ignavibacteria bacterium]MCU7500649.1 DedA family protein [Ignavibacteria bacterium]MCU7512776.1 DedA family protein [Ignavibacteria bacterium]MCU7520342.1 DedA family protein [Ignavibacteria bacterium]MCU7523945.1 DedA family protein [Ignavibacteria bacterium]
METINYWIQHYGYGGIYVLLMLGIVGVPVPDETLLALSGFLAFKGELSLIPVFFSGFLGSITGITISYFIGRGFGKVFLEKYGHYIHITKERLEKAHVWFKKIGKWALLFGYFIPGVRHVISLLAGSTKMNYPEFALYTYAGGFIWASTFISIGYFFGEKWQKVMEAIHRHIIISSIVLIIVITGVILLRNYWLNKKSIPAKDPGH